MLRILNYKVVLMKKNNVSNKTIERLSLYRRILKKELSGNNQFIFSYDLAGLANCKADQVRRDLMHLKNNTSTKKGYIVKNLISNIDFVLDSDSIQKMAIVGIGNMGRALIQYFKKRMKNMEIMAGFDIDKSRVDRVIAGCRCYHIDRMEEIIKQMKIVIGVITVPETDAQHITDILVKCGIRAIVNFAPVRVKTPAQVYVENLDLTTYFEKTAYFAKINKDQQP